MKNPLRYQLSEYDCGPTSMLNALAFLFEREDIPPEAVRNIISGRTAVCAMHSAAAALPWCACTSTESTM